ncbi:MAG: YibE/F family protein [Clostridiales bacterium]|nr:YibE/F family protein [Clostridiales bacterium]
MTKKAKKKSAKKAAPAAPAAGTALKEKSTIIALVIAAAVFFAALYGIYSDDILHGEQEMFSPYGDELVEFEKATVTEIPYENMEIDEAADGAYAGEQDLIVLIKSGQYKGETMEVDCFFSPLTGVPVEVGDSVTITIKTRGDGTRYASVYEYNRIPLLAVFLLLFFLVIIVIGGRTGLKSLIGLVFTVICLFALLIPLLLKGAPNIPTTFLMCVYIAFVCFTILGGVHRKSMSAFLGTAAGAFFAMVLGIVVQSLGKINGLRLEDAEPLLQLKYAGASVEVQGLLVASIIICALGAVMDVAMSISSALEEVHAANPSLSRRDLFRSGMNIGRDMVGTMTNTLILAFLGSEFTLMIFLYARGLSFYQLFSTAFVSLETISGLSSSLGMILAIPLTALISSALITRKRI